MSCETI